MNCRHVQELSTDYLDGELPLSIRIEVEQHLSSCMMCAKEISALRKTKLLLHLRSVPEPPRAYWGEAWMSISKRLEFDRSEEKELKPLQRFIRKIISHLLASIQFNPVPAIGATPAIALIGVMRQDWGLLLPRDEIDESKRYHTPNRVAEINLKHVRSYRF